MARLLLLLRVLLKQAVRQDDTPRPQQAMTRRATEIIYQSCDLDLLPFDLGTERNAICGTDNPPPNFWCFCDFSLSSYGQTRVKLTTLRYNIDL